MKHSRSSLGKLSILHGNLKRIHRLHALDFYLCFKKIKYRGQCIFHWIPKNQANIPRKACFLWFLFHRLSQFESSKSLVFFLRKYSLSVPPKQTPKPNIPRLPTLFLSLPPSKNHFSYLVIVFESFDIIWICYIKVKLTYICCFKAHRLDLILKKVS